MAIRNRWRGVGLVPSVPVLHASDGAGPVCDVRDGDRDEAGRASRPLRLPTLYARGGGLMDFLEHAGWRYEHRFCGSCEAEIAHDDPIYVDVDADYEDGAWLDRTRIECAACHAYRTEAA